VKGDQGKKGEKRWKRGKRGGKEGEKRGGNRVRNFTTRSFYVVTANNWGKNYM